VKILIRATNWVGDAIMALPALRAIRARFPDARISILARSYVVDIYRGQNICDELISYDPQGPHAGLRAASFWRKSYESRNLTSPCCSRTPLMPLGSLGAPAFLNASATRAMGAACC